jgi:hypothetical protein
MIISTPTFPSDMCLAKQILICEIPVVDWIRSEKHLIGEFGPNHEIVGDRARCA